MAFLLVCFFMMTTTFKTETPFEVELPDSRSEIKIPDKDICLISLSDQGELFMGVNSQFDRKEMLGFICKSKGIVLSEEQANNFARLNSFGVPIQELSNFLSRDLIEMKKWKQSGIPLDSSNNEFKNWLMAARIANPNIRFAIQADQKLKYPIVHQVIESLRELKINRFNLITNLNSSDAPAS
jgi:biopolymer transport protein ExbD